MPSEILSSLTMMVSEPIGSTLRIALKNVRVEELALKRSEVREETRFDHGMVCESERLDRSKLQVFYISKILDILCS